MKITDQFMVVMCDDGKFRNLPLPKQVPRVGERITVFLGKKKRFSLTWISSIAALFLLAITSVIWAQFQSAYAQVVAIDINPSLELYVDSKGFVKEAHARNQDAARLLDHRPVNNLSVQEAIQQVMRQSIADGYINPSKENLVMVTVADIKGDSEVDPNGIKTLLRETLEEKRMNGYFKVETAAEGLYQTSKEEGISLNKLILAQQAEQQGIKLDFKSNPSESVLQVLQKAGVQTELFFVPVTGQPDLEINTNHQTDHNMDNGQQNLQQPEKENGSQTGPSTGPQKSVNPQNGMPVPAGTIRNPGTSPAGAGDRNISSGGGSQNRPAENGKPNSSGSVPKEDSSSPKAGSGLSETKEPGDTLPENETPSKQQMTEQEYRNQEESRVDGDYTDDLQQQSVPSTAPSSTQTNTSTSENKDTWEMSNRN